MVETGTVIHREIIQFQVQEEGSGKLKTINGHVTEYNNSKDTSIRLEGQQANAMDKTVAVQDVYSVSTKNMTRQVHMANMAVLGINMSLLGLSWNLSRAGIFSDKTNEKITKIIAPVQMVASVVNLSASAWQLYNIVSKLARTEAILNASTFIKTNTALTFSFLGLRWSIISVGAALGGLSALFGAFITKSPVLRGVLSAIGAAMLVFAARTQIATMAKIMFNSQMGPVGWLAIVAGLAIASAFTASYLALGNRLGLWRGGIALGRTHATIGELGPEAVVPLNSPTGRRMLGGGSGGGSGMSIQNAYFTVQADRPSTLFRNTNVAVKRQIYVEE